MIFFSQNDKNVAINLISIIIFMRVKMKKLIYLLLSVNILTISSFILGQSTNYYPITSTLWEGNSYTQNVYNGTWIPNQGNNYANFSYGDYSWAQVRTKNYINQGSTVQFTTQLLLNSGGVHKDEAYFGFGDKWIAYDGNAAGICFSNNTIYTFKTISASSVYPVLLQSIGTYNTNENITFSLTLNNDGTITYNIKGAVGTFNPALNITNYRILITCAGTQDGFNVSNVNATTMTNLIDSQLLIPQDYYLAQNYPNPFNPSTTIRYSTPLSQHLKISVYDILGNVVSILVDEFKSTGSYEVLFDGSNLTSGVYFYTLEAGTITLTKKLILIK